MTQVNQFLFLSDPVLSKSFLNWSEPGLIRVSGTELLHGAINFFSGLVVYVSHKHASQILLQVLKQPHSPSQSQISHFPTFLHVFQFSTLNLPIFNSEYILAFPYGHLASFDQERRLYIHFSFAASFLIYIQRKERLRPKVRKMEKHECAIKINERKLGKTKSEAKSPLNLRNDSPQQKTKGRFKNTSQWVYIKVLYK